MKEKFTPTKSVEKLPHRYNEVAHLLGPFSELKGKVEKALEASRHGGFEVGTRGFIRYIIGQVEVSEEHYRICRRVIMDIAKKKEGQVKKDEPETAQEADFTGEIPLGQLARDAEKQIEIEKRRVSGLGAGEEEIAEDEAMTDIGY